MKFLTLINENSGTVMSIGVDSVEQTVRSALSESGHETDIIKGGCADLIAAAEKADQYDTVICAGGDGTQAAIGGALRGKKAALLPLPCGTMNLLCRDLGIPLEIDQAIRTALAAPTEKIDVGVAGGRVFLNNVVFGSYADLAEAREELREVENLEDLSFALVTAADSLFHADPIKFHLEIDDKPADVKTNTVIVSINKITSSENMVPHRDRLAEGELVVYLTDSKNGAEFTKLLVDFARGEADAASNIQSIPCKKCRVGARDKTFSYTIDGDPLESSSSIELRVDKKALNVRYPTPEEKPVARAAE